MIIFLIFLITFASAQDECQPTSCSPSGPIIRFPFRLINHQPERCGYPGFDLSCDPNNITEFQFQFPVRASARNTILPNTSARATVQEIDYLAQTIRVRVQNGSCLPTRLPEVNSSPAQPPFEMNDRNDGYTLLNCSSVPGNGSGMTPVPCLDSPGFVVYALPSVNRVTDVLLSSCVRMYNISYIPPVIFDGPGPATVNDTRFFFWLFEDTRLRWREPVCGGCEARGMHCRSRNNNRTNSEIECLEAPREPRRSRRGVLRNVLITVGVFLIALALAALYRFYIVKKNLRRTRQFLEDYEARHPTRYTYAEVKRITDGFKHKLGQGGFGAVFKGKLSNEILVAVKVLDNTKGNGEDFLNEVGTIGKIHHVHVVRLVGYCADGYRRALVYEFLENDSLEKYISSGNQSKTLGWEKLHKIALGVAKGIDYLHQGCNQRILHFDIKPQNILLDHNLNPKVADFGLAKLCSKEKSVVTMTAARGTIGYIAPEVFSRNFGTVSYKSDIYSFGMLLLDMVGGRKKFNAMGQESSISSSSEVYFPEWMYSQLEKGEDIAIQIEKEDESDIVKRLIIVGLWCIQWYPADRPSTKVVIQMLEGESMPIMPPNPFASSESHVNTPATVDTKATSGGSLFTSAQTSFSS